MTARLKAVIEFVVVGFAGVVLSTLPAPTPPQLVALPVPTPSVPSVLPSPTASSSAGAPHASAPPTALPNTGQSGSTAPAASVPPEQGLPGRVPIPFTAIYVSSPLDVALIGALVTLPLLLAIWLFLLLRTADHARRARDAETRLLLAADLGVHPRDLGTVSTKALFDLREKAAFDELTGVLRRAVGIGVAEQEVARARRLKAPLTVAFMDIDDLKEANEQNGRAAGDEMLRGLVQVLKAGLRAQDFLFRYGGDEFVCILPDTRANAARATLGDIQAEAAKSGIRFCIGVAELAKSDDVVSLFARADRDLYEFKTNRGEIVPFPAAEGQNRTQDSLTAN